MENALLENRDQARTMVLEKQQMLRVFKSVGIAGIKLRSPGLSSSESRVGLASNSSRRLRSLEGA